MFKIFVTSTSAVKISAINQGLDKFLGFPFEIKPQSVTCSNNPNQPINSSYECALNRIKASGYFPLNQNNMSNTCQLIISTENGINISENICEDICTVVIMDLITGLLVSGNSFLIPVDKKYYLRAKELSDKDGYKSDLGIKYTIGEMIHQENPSIPSDNWMKEVQFGPVLRGTGSESFFSPSGQWPEELTKRTTGVKDRRIQIEDALEKALFEYKKQSIKKYIQFYPNFPKPGITFQSLEFVLYNPILLHWLVDLMAERVIKEFPLDKYKGKIKFLGLDARGFIYGSLLAQRLGCGFVMIRKKNKQPGEKHSVEYGTEYSKDVLELMTNIIKKDDPVIVVDDLIATGGSLDATFRLATMAQAKFLGYVTILKVTEIFDKAVEKLKPHQVVVILD